MMTGGCTDAQLATAEIQAKADQVKAQLEEKTKKKYSVFRAVEYSSQLVAGTNYFIKVQVDGDRFVHLRVFESLPHEGKPLSLHSYQVDKTADDKLTYF